MKQKSKRAQKDENCVNIIKNKNSSQRTKDKAFSDLFHRHNKTLYFVFLKKLNGDSNTAEDLVSDTFRKMFEGIDTFNSEKAVFSTWLYTVASNNFIDHTRKVKMEVFSLEKMVGKNSEEAEGMSYQITSNELNPQQEVSNTALGKEIHDAIYDLPNKLVRDVMIKLYIEELSFKEIAQDLGFAEDCSTPRVNAKRGREILAKKLSHLQNFAR